MICCSLSCRIHLRQYDLWASDGNASGTRIVELSSDPTGVTLPRDLIEFNGALYFVANSVDGAQLWKTYGNDHDAQQITHVVPGSGSGATNLTVAGERLYFRSFDPLAGIEPFSTDGTPEGTVLLGDFNTAGSSSNPGDYVGIGDFVYFFAFDSTNGRGLWRSDGTDAGTVLVHPKVSIYRDNFPLQELTQIGDRLYFVNDDYDIRQFWESDGTPEGTRRITNVPELVISHEFYDFENLVLPHLVGAGGTLYFAGRNIDGEYGGAGFSLWKIDDSPMGASIVKNFPTQDDRGPRFLTSVAGKLYFTAPDDSATRKIWVSDGTPEGTHVVANFAPIKQMFAVDDSLYFNAEGALWRLDPETNAVIPIADGFLTGSSINYPSLVVEVNDLVFFPTRNGQLWKTDGTEAGTSLLTTLYPEESGVQIQQLAAAGGLLYFTVHRSGHSPELWRSDGTLEGIQFLGENMGLIDRAYAEVDGRLYFVQPYFPGYDSPVLFVTDGTQAGTRVVADQLSPIELSSFPDLGVSNGRVFFTKDDGIHGEELFMLPTSAPGDANDDGVVDYRDYTRWADHFLRPGDWGFAQGDFNRDGKVDGGDYTLWADSYVAPPVGSGGRESDRDIGAGNSRFSRGGRLARIARHEHVNSRRRRPSHAGLGRSRGWLFCQRVGETFVIANPAPQRPARSRVAKLASRSELLQTSTPAVNKSAVQQSDAATEGTKHTEPVQPQWPL